MRRSGTTRSVWLAAFLASALVSSGAAAATIQWKGHTWQVTSGGMAGVCQGNPANVSIDADGYLHFHIANAGGTWTAAEIFTTDKLGFGTYQWQVDGPIDTYDKNVVLGLFPYGPAAGIGGDGTNEIDIEYSRWGVASGPNGDFTDYPASGNTVGELSYTFSLGGSTLSTSRFVWTTSSITSSLLKGLVAVGANDNVLETWTYMPTNPITNVPQQALPLGMNLWCFDAPPSDGQPVEIVVRDFTFVPEGAGVGGGGGRGGGGANGASGAAGADDAGAGGTLGTSGAGGAGRAGGAGSAGSGGTAASAGTGASAGAVGGGAAGGRPSGTTGGSGGARSGSPGAAGTATAGARTAGSGGEGGRATTGAGGVRSAGTGGTASTAAGNAHGCGCSVPGRGNRTPAGIAALVVLAGAARRRRRFAT